MPKTTKNKPPAATCAERNARWRKSKVAKEKDMIAELNAKRAHFNLPQVAKPARISLKGTKRPEYAPPTKMSKDKLKEWKAKDRKRRKALMQRENRRQEEAKCLDREHERAVVCS